MSACKFIYFAFIFSECIWIISSEEALKVREHNFFHPKVVLLVIYCSITIHLSQLSSCWIWHLTFSCVQFLSNKLESFVSFNIKLFCSVFDMFFFYKNLIILHHGDWKKKYLYLQKILYCLKNGLLLVLSDNFLSTLGKNNVLTIYISY